MKLYEHLITTSTGGIIVTLLTTPLDVIKVRLIAQTLPSHTSLPHHHREVPILAREEERREVAKEGALQRHHECHDREHVAHLYTRGEG